MMARLKNEQTVSHPGKQVSVEPPSAVVQNAKIFAPKNFDYENYFKHKQFELQQKFTKNAHPAIDISHLMGASDQFSSSFNHMKVMNLSFEKMH